jgi:hypothetical protein
MSALQRCSEAPGVPTAQELVATSRLGVALGCRRGQGDGTVELRAGFGQEPQPLGHGIDRRRPAAYPLPDERRCRLLERSDCRLRLRERVGPQALRERSDLHQLLVDAHGLLLERPPQIGMVLGLTLGHRVHGPNRIAQPPVQPCLGGVRTRQARGARVVTPGTTSFSLRFARATPTASAATPAATATRTSSTHSVAVMTPRRRRR